MKENITIVQLRSTIFLQQNIGYTPENAEKFKVLLMPNAKAYSIPQPGMFLGINPDIPQYGMPWRLFEKSPEGGEYNIAFHPGKIDIVLAKEISYGNETEKEFLNKSTEWFSKILDTQGNTSATRIAYAPLYAIKNKEEDYNTVWGNFLKRTSFDGIKSQDINLSFLLKSYIKVGEKDIPMNFLHNIFDGNQIKNENGIQTLHKVLLFQLDLNSIPEENLNLNKEGINDFYNKIVEIKNKLVDNVTV